jgi:hypothetical protein
LISSRLCALRHPSKVDQPQRLSPMIFASAPIAH